MIVYYTWVSVNGLIYNGDFVTNSYGESWDSSCERSLVPIQNQWVSESQLKTKSEIENAWAFI